MSAATGRCRRPVAWPRSTRRATLSQIRLHGVVAPSEGASCRGPAIRSTIPEYAGGPVAGRRGAHVATPPGQSEATLHQTGLEGRADARARLHWTRSTPARG